MSVRVAASAIILLIFFFPAAGFSALTTEELLQLKKAGVKEEIILYLNKKDYKDVEKVLKLKAAAFTDETILSIIKNDLNGESSLSVSKDERVRDNPHDESGVESTSKISILWYSAFKSGPVLLEKQTISKARVIMGPEKIGFEWEDKGVFDILFKKPFKSPFYWDINKDDLLTIGKEGCPLLLKSTANHKGRPETDDSHFWAVCLDTGDARITDFLRQNLMN